MIYRKTNLIFIFVCFIVTLKVVLCVIDYKGLNIYTYPDDENAKTALFRDRDSILALFERARSQYPRQVEKALHAYHSCFEDDGENLPFPTGRRKPFIVIEGNNLQQRQVVAKLLADTLGVSMYRIPPKCMSQYATIFPRGSILKSAYFALSLYAAAHKIKQNLANGYPVVANGYWSEQSSFVIGKQYKRPSDLPRRGSEIYDIPSDLFVPDMLIYLNHKYSDNKFEFSTVTPDYIPKKIQIYLKFSQPGVTIIDSSKGVDNTVVQIHQKMRFYLEHLDLSQRFVLFKEQRKITPNKNFTSFYFDNIQSLYEDIEEERKSKPYQVEELLRAYNSCFTVPDVDITQIKKRRPFIVVEGNLKRNKEFIGRIFADSIGATYLLIPPKCMANKSRIFDQGSVLKKLFFTLSLYAAAFNARQLLAVDSIVVLNGYWTEQISFLLNKNFYNVDDLPPAGSKHYRYPTDLMRPDLLLYIHTQFEDFELSPKNRQIEKYSQEYNETALYAKDWNEKALEVYRRFDNPKPVIIDSRAGFYNTSEKMYYAMTRELTTFDLTISIPRDVFH